MVQENTYGWKFENENPGCSIVRPKFCLQIGVSNNEPPKTDFASHHIRFKPILGSLYPHVLLVYIPMSIGVCLKMGYNPGIWSFWWGYIRVISQCIKVFSPQFPNQSHCCLYIYYILPYSIVKSYHHCIPMIFPLKWAVCLIKEDSRISSRERIPFRGAQAPHRLQLFFLTLHLRRSSELEVGRVSWAIFLNS
jgi:hypothetical protein